MMKKDFNEEEGVTFQGGGYLLAWRCSVLDGNDIRTVIITNILFSVLLTNSNY